MNKIKDNLPKLPFWNNLTAKQKDFTEANSVIRTFGKKSMIQGADTCLGMILVLKGVLRIYLLSEEGREITLFKIEKGEICVLSASCVISQITFETQIVAEADCELLILTSGAFEKLANENIYVKCFMYELTTERFSSVMWTMQQILFSGMDKRLSNFLITQYEKNGSIEIKMTHEEIAQQISSAREVVARMLKRFASEGIVELKRGVIILKNINELKKIR